VLSKSALYCCLSYCGCAVKFSPFLHGTCSGKFATSALDEGDLLASHTGHCTTWKRVTYPLNVSLSETKELFL